jgi:hypothetical protein
MLNAPVKVDGNVAPVLNEEMFARAVEAVKNSSWGRSTIIVHPKTVVSARDVAWRAWMAALRCTESRELIRRWHWIARKRLQAEADEQLHTAESMWNSFGYGSCTYVR